MFSDVLGSALLGKVLRLIRGRPAHTLNSLDTCHPWRHLATSAAQTPKAGPSAVAAPLARPIPPYVIHHGQRSLKSKHPTTLLKTLVHNWITPFVTPGGTLRRRLRERRGLRLRLRWRGRRGLPRSLRAGGRVPAGVGAPARLRLGLVEPWRLLPPPGALEGGGKLPTHAFELYHASLLLSSQAFGLCCAWS